MAESLLKFDNFNSYTNGTLVGQGDWIAYRTGVVSSLTVAGTTEKYITNEALNSTQAVTLNAALKQDALLTARVCFTGGAFTPNASVTFQLRNSNYGPDASLWDMVSVQFVCNATALYSVVISHRYHNSSVTIASIGYAASNKLTWTDGVYKTIGFRANGRLLTVYVDGTPILSAVFGLSYQLFSGYVSITATNVSNTSARIDDINYYELTADVSPTNFLTHYSRTIYAQSAVNWATVRSATTGTVSDSGRTVINASSRLSGGIYTIFRGYLYFDTSLIPDEAEIISATLDVTNVITQGNQAGCYIVESTASLPPLPADYASVGSVAFSDLFGVGTASNTHISISLNASGLAGITKNGITKLAVRGIKDFENTSSHPLTQYYGNDFAGAENTTPPYRPVLTVVFSSGIKMRFKALPIPIGV